MKKFLQVSLAATVLFFGFGGSSASANEMLYASMLIQDTVKMHHCPQIQTAGLPIEQSTEVEENLIEPFSTEQAFPIEVRTSRNGNTIALSSGKYAGYGYCHIFNRHMIESNGTLKKKASFGDKPSQFQYAHYTEKLMDIAMQVINSGAREYPAGADGRLKKTLQSSKSGGQTIEVIYIKPRDLKHNRYDAYDYVILTMYPKF